MYVILLFLYTFYDIQLNKLGCRGWKKTEEIREDISDLFVENVGPHGVLSYNRLLYTRFGMSLERDRGSRKKEIWDLKGFFINRILSLIFRFS